jgi:hypothetical protein
MKNQKLLFFLCFLFVAQNIVFAQNTSFGIELRAGYNFSDVDYGIAHLDHLIPISDYPIFSRAEEGELGYSFGIGAAFSFGKHIELLTNIDFIRLNYDVATGVFDEGSIPPNRPVQPDVPIIIAGTVGYSYINIETGLRYSFKPDSRTRPFVGIFINDMIHLNTAWTFTVKYQDNQIADKIDFSENQDEITFSNVFFAGMNAGCQFMITENFSIAPMIDFRYGLNPVVKNEPGIKAPFVLGFNIQGKWWF